MIDLEAARQLAETIKQGDVTAAFEAATVLLTSIDSEYGIFGVDDYSQALIRPSKDVPSLDAEVERLRFAIRQHRDEKGDDRCWMDDQRLYEILPEGVGDADLRLCPPDEMLTQCKRYIATRHDPNTPYVSPQRVLDNLRSQLSATDVTKFVDRGHSLHCAKRMAWGDGVCECNLISQDPATIREWQKAIHQYALDKGWYDNDTRTFGDMCALFTSEISEAYDEYRNGHEVTETYFNPDKPEKAEGVPTELADTVIRILDFCGRHGIDLQEVMAHKHAYNQKRPYRHGGKRT